MDSLKKHFSGLRILLVFGFVLFLFTLGCGKKREIDIPRPDPNAEVARFGNILITTQDVLIDFQESHSFMEFLNPNQEMLTNSIRDIAQKMAFHRHLAQQAQQKGLDQRPAFKEYHKDTVRVELYQRLIIDEILRKIEITEKDLEEFYQDQKRSLFLKRNTSDVYKLRAIYIYFGPDKRSQEEAMDLAQEAYEKLEQGQPFESVAREYSEAPSAPVDKRGKVSAIPPHLLSLDLENRLSELKDGEYTEPFVIDDKVFIYYREEYVPPKYTPFEEVRDQISQRIYRDRRSQGIYVFSQELKQKYQAEIFPDLLTKKDIANATSVILSVPDVHELTLEEFNKLAEYKDKTTLKEKEEYLDLLLNEAVCYAEALEQGYSPDEIQPVLDYHDEQRLATLYIQSQFEDESLPESEIKHIYENHSQYPNIEEHIFYPQQFDLYHLFFKMEYSPLMQQAELQMRLQSARSRAERAREYMLQGVPFEEVVQLVLEDQSSKVEGGHLGTIPLKEMLPAVNSIVSRMELGQISQVERIHSDQHQRYGFGIYYVKEILPEKRMPYDEAKPTIIKLWENGKYNTVKKNLLEEFNNSHKESLNEEIVESIIEYLQTLAKRQDLQVDVARYQETHLQD